MSRATAQCARYRPSWRWCYQGVMQDCGLQSASENVHSQTEFGNKYRVSITSHLCSSKMGLCLFLLTLALLFLGILNWIFQALFSRDGSFISKCHCTFPRVSEIRHNCLLAAAVWYPRGAAQFVLNSSRTGSVAVWWEGPRTLAELSLGALASGTSILAFILKHQHVQRDCCVLQKLKFSRGAKVTSASSTGETFWLQTWASHRYWCSRCSFVTSVSDPFRVGTSVPFQSGDGF